MSDCYTIKEQYEEIERLRRDRNAWRQLAKDMGEFLSGACPDAQAWVGDGGLAERLDALES